MTWYKDKGPHIYRQATGPIRMQKRDRNISHMRASRCIGLDEYSKYFVGPRYLLLAPKFPYVSSNDVAWNVDLLTFQERTALTGF